MDQVSFVDALLPARFGRNARLERIAGLIDWAPIERLVADIHPGETGRPPYWPLAMFKALLLHQWYGLSDPGLEEALLDRVSFRRFCGFALDAAIPDETTLCRFRNALKAAERGEALFAAIGAQLDASGFILRKGTLIDATLVASAAAAPPSGSTPKGVESRSPHDHDANWTRQGHSRRLFFGYKLHIGVDQGSGLIRSRCVTPAKTYESEVADALVIGDERAGSPLRRRSQSRALLPGSIELCETPPLGAGTTRDKRFVTTLYHLRLESARATRQVRASAAGRLCRCGVKP